MELREWGNGGDNGLDMTFRAHREPVSEKTALAMSVESRHTVPGHWHKRVRTRMAHRNNDSPNQLVVRILRHWASLERRGASLLDAASVC